MNFTKKNILYIITMEVIKMGRELRRKEAKKKNNKIKKVEEIDTSIKGSTLLKLIAISVFMVALLYLVVAIFITKEVEISWFNNKEEVINEVLENRILAKNTFNQKESTYYVYFYDFTDEDVTVTSATGLSEDKLYVVDTSSGLNKNYVSEESSNRSVSSIDDLKVKSPTVIKITDDKVVGYYEGSSEIISHFEAR